MPVNYVDDVASATSWRWTRKVFVRWRRSLYQGLWLPVLCYVAAFVAVRLIYTFALIPTQQKSFKNFTQYCDGYAKQFQFLVALMLGIFTLTVVHRWWSVSTSMPGTAEVINKARLTITPTTDPTNVSIVQTISRYTVLSWILHMRIVCRTIRQKYPTLQSMESSGLLLPEETAQLEDADVENQITKPWLPIVWSTLLLGLADLGGRITFSQDAVNLRHSLERFRNNCNTILNYYFTNTPLVSTQYMTLMVHTFGIANLFGKQFLDPNSDKPALVLQTYVPFLPVLQYVGYLGWLKLVEILNKPFREDEDYFDLNKELEKNLESISFIINSYRELEDYTPEETAESVVPEEAEEHENAEEGEDPPEEIILVVGQLPFPLPLF